MRPGMIPLGGKEPQTQQVAAVEHTTRYATMLGKIVVDMKTHKMVRSGLYEVGCTDCALASIKEDI